MGRLINFATNVRARYPWPITRGHMCDILGTWCLALSKKKEKKRNLPLSSSFSLLCYCFLRGQPARTKCVDERTENENILIALCKRHPKLEIEVLPLAPTNNCFAASGKNQLTWISQVLLSASTLTSNVSPSIDPTPIHSVRRTAGWNWLRDFVSHSSVLEVHINLVDRRLRDESCAVHIPFSCTSVRPLHWRVSDNGGRDICCL